MGDELSGTTKTRGECPAERRGNCNLLKTFHFSLRSELLGSGLQAAKALLGGQRRE